MLSLSVGMVLLREVEAVESVVFVVDEIVDEASDFDDLPIGGRRVSHATSGTVASMVISP